MIGPAGTGPCGHMEDNIGGPIQLHCAAHFGRPSMSQKQGHLGGEQPDGYNRLILLFVCVVIPGTQKAGKHRELGGVGVSFGPFAA